MGGYGSGQWRSRPRKLTVEECIVLSAGKLQRDGVLRAGIASTGTLTWTRTGTGEELSSVGFRVNTLGHGGFAMDLHYTATRSGERVDYTVGLTTTTLPWGGVRWWFVCPLIANGRACGRRCGKLYLPPGGRYFGCRLCYDLSYVSAQEAHKWDGMYRMLAAQTGMSPRAVERALKELYC
jgi:hypothetical protein